MRRFLFSMSLLSFLRCGSSVIRSLQGWWETRFAIIVQHRPSQESKQRRRIYRFYDSLERCVAPLPQRFLPLLQHIFPTASLYPSRTPHAYIRPAHVGCLHAHASPIMLISARTHCEDRGVSLSQEHANTIWRIHRAAYDAYPNFHQQMLHQRTQIVKMNTQRPRVSSLPSLK
jgi:hypothetical protein